MTTIPITPDPPAIPSEEDLLLTRSEAEKILLSHGRRPSRVERVCDDGAILFLSEFKRPWTAWLERSDDGLTVIYEEGWSAEFGSCARVSDPRPVALTG